MTKNDPRIGKLLINLNHISSSYPDKVRIISEVYDDGTIFYHEGKEFGTINYNFIILEETDTEIIWEYGGD